MFTIYLLFMPLLLLLETVFSFFFFFACKQSELNCSQLFIGNLKEYVLDYIVSSEKTKNISFHNFNVFCYRVKKQTVINSSPL